MGGKWAYSHAFFENIQRYGRSGLILEPST